MLSWQRALVKQAAMRIHNSSGAGLADKESCFAFFATRILANMLRLYIRIDSAASGAGCFYAAGLCLSRCAQRGRCSGAWRSRGLCCRWCCMCVHASAPGGALRTGWGCKPAVGGEMFFEAWVDAAAAGLFPIQRPQSVVLPVLAQPVLALVHFPIKSLVHRRRSACLFGGRRSSRFVVIENFNFRLIIQFWRGPFCCWCLRFCPAGSRLFFDPSRQCSSVRA